jgi:hypothetical protein
VKLAGVGATADQTPPFRFMAVSLRNSRKNPDDGAEADQAYAESCLA